MLSLTSPPRLFCIVQFTIAGGGGEGYANYVSASYVSEAEVGMGDVLLVIEVITDSLYGIAWYVVVVVSLSLVTPQYLVPDDLFSY